MNRRPLVPLLVIAVLLAATVSWLALRSAEDSPPDDTVAAAAPADQAPAPDAEGAMDAALTPVTDPEQARTVVEEPVEAPAVETLPLQGTVVLPPGTPADEQLFVLATRRPMGMAELYGSPGPAMATWEPLRATQESKLLAAAAVEADATFRLELPLDADVDVVHLAVGGRYLYSKATTPVSLPPAQDVVLTGRLGAWITGRLLPPDDPRPEEADFELVDVELGPDVTGGFDATAIQSSAVDHGDEVDADGRFEFRAVSTELAHGIAVKHPHLAAQVRLGLRPGAGEHLAVEITMRRGAVLRGRAVDDEGQPVGGAEIEVRFRGALGDALDGLRETGADEEGRFELVNVASGALDVLGSYPGYCDGVLRLAEDVEDGTLIEGLEVVLDRGLTLTGRVTFADGAPAPAATVKVAGDLSKATGLDAARVARAPKRSALTDADGRFTIGGLTDIQLRVRAKLAVDEGDRAGAWLAKAGGVTPGEESLELVLEGLHDLAGRVTDEAGEPVTDFAVSATLQGSGAMFGFGAERLQWAFPDEPEGRFTVEGLSSGSWDVVVRADGFATSETVEVVLPAAPGAPDLEFVLLPAAGMSGVVLDTGDVPVPGAQVSLDLGIAERMEMTAGGGIPTTYTDVEGRFRLHDLEPGSIAVSASLDGFAPSESVTREVLPGQVAEEVVLRLRVGGTLTGEVLDEEGGPDAGRMVVVQLTPSFATQHILTTDGDGRFRAEHLAPGRWQVVATPNMMTEGLDQEGDGNMAEFLGQLKMDFVEIVDGEETHVVLGQPPANPVHLRVRLEHGGEPVAGAIVSFVPEDAEGLSAMKMKSTGDDGTLAIDLDRSGAYLVTVQMAAEIGRQNSLEFLERIPDEREHELVLELPLGRISGRVFGPDGDPLVDCRVSLAVDGGTTWGSFLGGHYTEVSTDGDGAYDIPCLRPGEYVVSAGGALLGGMLGDTGDGGRTSKSGLRVGEGQWLEGVDFHLAAAGELAGLVVDATGAPAANASVFVRDEHGRLLERFSLITTDANGRFVYPGLAPGVYTVSARLGASASAESTAVQVPEGGSADVRVALEPGTVLRVTLADAGEELRRARVSVIDGEGRELAGMRSMSEIMEGMGLGFSTEEQRIGPLPPGRYKVVATLPDGREARKNVTLRGREERRVRLRFE